MESDERGLMQTEFYLYDRTQRSAALYGPFARRTDAERSRPAGDWGIFHTRPLGESEILKAATVRAADQLPGRQLCQQQQSQ